MYRQLWSYGEILASRLKGTSDFFNFKMSLSISLDKRILPNLKNILIILNFLRSWYLSKYRWKTSRIQSYDYSNSEMF